MGVSKRDMNQNVRTVCDEVSKAFEMRYFIGKYGTDQVHARFNPKKDVDVYVKKLRESAKNPYSVDILLTGDRNYSGQYRPLLEPIKHARLADDVWFLSDERSVEMEVSDDYGLKAVLMYVLSNMRNSEELSDLSCSAKKDLSFLLEQELKSNSEQPDTYY